MGGLWDLHLLRTVWGKASGSDCGNLCGVDYTNNPDTSSLKGSIEDVQSHSRRLPFSSQMHPCPVNPQRHSQRSQTQRSPSTTKTFKNLSLPFLKYKPVHTDIPSRHMQVAVSQWASVCFLLAESCIHCPAITKCGSFTWPHCCGIAVDWPVFRSLGLLLLLWYKRDLHFTHCSLLSQSSSDDRRRFLHTPAKQQHRHCSAIAQLACLTSSYDKTVAVWKYN